MPTPPARGSRAANPWLNPNPLCRLGVQQPARPLAADLSVITEAVSKEVAATVEGPVLLEQYRKQELALPGPGLQAALQAAQQEAQAAQQAAQQAAEQTAQHKAPRRLSTTGNSRRRY